eukprot:m.529368 g.529368  ORF g.529368 m.529368 type:complete len:95 (+) comp22017_c1_seq3:92-376(+)
MHRIKTLTLTIAHLYTAASLGTIGVLIVLCVPTCTGAATACHNKAGAMNCSLGGAGIPGMRPLDTDVDLRNDITANITRLYAWYHAAAVAPDPN